MNQLTNVNVGIVTTMRQKNPLNIGQNSSMLRFLSINSRKNPCKISIFYVSNKKMFILFIWKIIFLLSQSPCNHQMVYLSH